MSKYQHQRPQPAIDDPRWVGLLGGIGSALAAGLAMYRGWHS